MFEGLLIFYCFDFYCPLSETKYVDFQILIDII